MAGEHWYPRDVEEVLVRHEAVRDAALVGLPDERGEHRPIAFVTLRPDASADPSALTAFVRSNLGRIPPGMELEIVPAMPMTPTGKISKAALIDQVAAR